MSSEKHLLITVAKP